MPQTSAITCERGDFRGWPDAYTLDNGLVSLVAVPALGGRVMAYGLRGESALWVNPTEAGRLYSFEEHQGDGSLAGWKNYGGAKAWPAPQGWGGPGQWAGPPDAVLDGGRYSADVSQSGVLTLASPPDPERTGLQITRRIGLRPHTTLTDMRLTYTNVSRRRIAWSLWENVQLSCESAGGGWARGCRLFVPTNPRSRFPGGYTVQYGTSDNPQWQPGRLPGIFTVDYQWQVGKIGLDSDAGWLAFHHSETGSVFCLLFPNWPELADKYPDGGCSAECWTSGEGTAAGVDWGARRLYHLEAEVLSPVFSLEPGESAAFPLTWAACKCPAPVLKAGTGGVVQERLSRRVRQGLMTGTFGFFHQGQAFLLLRLAGGFWVDIPLGPTSPERALDLRFPLGTYDAVRADLVVEDGAGVRHTLDTWTDPGHEENK